ncbi:hypothetical protein [Megasphaera elsdenii]|uniref:hypothetical protein n=1 Tax=Megasphaera elsdenii TaxID=907 RepID=UPI0039F57553
MSDTAIKEAMDYEKQFATNNKLKSAYWEHERTMRDIASALYSREKAGQELLTLFSPNKTYSGLLRPKKP